MSVLDNARNYFEKTPDKKMIAEAAQTMTQLKNLAELGETRDDAALLVRLATKFKTNDPQLAKYALSMVWKFCQEYPAWILLDSIDAKMSPNFYVFRSLVEQHANELDDRLATIYRSIDNNEQQLLLLEAIEPLAYEKIFGFVLGVLNSSDTIYSRAKTARILMDKDQAETLRRFQEVVLDPHYSVACEIIARFFGEQGEAYLQDLVHLANHKDYAVRFQAINAIANLGSLAAAKELINLLRNDQDINNTADGLKTLLRKKEEEVQTYYTDFIKTIYAENPDFFEVVSASCQKHPDSSTLSELLDKVSLSNLSD